MPEPEISPAQAPPEALRRGVSRGVVVAVVIVVALLMLGAGVYAGKTIYGGSKSTASSFLVVGTNIPFPPFEDYNYSTGTYFGFDIDLAGMIANASHRTLVIQNYADFSVLLSTVGKGGIDMAASAITESGSAGAARNATMAFSNNYYDANQAVLVRSSSSLSCASNICSANDLKTLIVGMQSGTTSQSWGDQYLKPNMTHPNTQYQLFTTVDTELTALRASSLDAVVIDAAPAAAIAASSGGALKVAGTIITGELYGFAVAHGDPEGLLPVINSVLAKAMADGTYQALIHKWFK
ncbi:MAG: transporter substrate-binding domain-containing protein [Thermoplasmata archaeon]|nr:transporter substrate-binding domain-containing protein [Thermoplasmata archaeon]